MIFPKLPEFLPTSRNLPHCESALCRIMLHFLPESHESYMPKWDRKATRAIHIAPEVLFVILRYGYIYRGLTCFGGLTHWCTSSWVLLDLIVSSYCVVGHVWHALGSSWFILVCILSLLSTFQRWGVNPSRNKSAPQSPEKEWIHWMMFMHLMLQDASICLNMFECTWRHAGRKEMLHCCTPEQPRQDEIGTNSAGWHAESCWIMPHRIHGAGIYANMTGVYWWDPCYHIIPYITWILWVLNHAESCWGWCGQPFQPIWLWRFAVVASWQGRWTTETELRHMGAFLHKPRDQWSKMIQNDPRLVQTS